MNATKREQKKDQYEKVKKYPSTADLNISDLPRPLFRGYLPGSAFITKKSYRGNKIATQWLDQLFDSFDNDDDELCAIALESSLVDMSIRVSGGLYGAPFSIGEYGFYTKFQFDSSVTLLQDERRNFYSNEIFLYPSAVEFDRINKDIKARAFHGSYRFLYACRGDSLLVLAIRKRAFLVASVLLLTKEYSIFDRNEDGNTYFDIVKRDYIDQSDSLMKRQAGYIARPKAGLTSTEFQEEENLSIEMLDCYRRFLSFLQTMAEYFKNAIGSLLISRHIYREFELRKEVVPGNIIEKVRELISHEEHLEECESIIARVLSKLGDHQRVFDDFRLSIVRSVSVDESNKTVCKTDEHTTLLYK